MKKYIRIIYITLFFIICTVPLLFMPFVKNDSSSENRRLSDMPSLKTDKGNINLEFTSQFETYFSEHFAFREKLVTADSFIKSAIFRTSSSEKVIIGNNDWLYYSLTLDDYTGTDQMSRRKINNTAKTLALIQEYVEKSGSQFIFMTAPNKNSVYNHNMPSRYKKNPDARGASINYEMLSKALSEQSVNNLDLFELFMSDERILYHTRDSHWTNEGALLACNAIMDKAGIEYDDYSNVPKHTEISWHSDLDKMLFPSYEHLSEQVIYDKDFSFKYTYNFKNSDDILISTKNNDKSAKILMYRDSFGRAIYPFISENSGEAIYSREMPFRMDLLDKIKADVTIIEIVERNLSYITDSAPFMESPMRNIDISASVETSENNSCFISENNGLTRIYGKLDESYFNDNSNIYITLEGENKILCYEAFPIYEAGFLNDDNQSDYGYSLYINPSDIPEGEYAVNAYISNEQGFICTDTLKNIEF